ncbi:MAG: cytochrome c family protein [Pseudomonadota bacterium]|nr:cytochrome c family protein [Pseudomonadota bacterium]
MTQLFTPRSSRLLRVSLLALPLLVSLGFGSLYLYVRSDAAWNVGVAADQPIAFRHDLHAGDLGLDCRYCHASVENAASAGMPSAQTCMTCHSQVWTGLAPLEPLRTSVAFDAPIEWTSVHKLPAHAFFHHGIHVAKGVACQTCHGRVDRMTQTVKTETLSMGWCLDCHRNPGTRLSEPEQVFSMTEAGTAALSSQQLMALHDITVDNLTDCSTCHR